MKLQNISTLSKTLMQYIKQIRILSRLKKNKTLCYYLQYSIKLFMYSNCQYFLGLGRFPIICLKKSKEVASQPQWHLSQIKTK